MPKSGFSILVLGAVSFLASIALSMADELVDMRPYLPIEQYDGKAYQFAAITRNGTVYSWQTYRVSRENNILYLDFNDYDQSFMLLAENRQKETDKGLFFVEKKMYFRGKGGKIESSSPNVSGVMILPWKIKKGDSFSKIYSFRTYYNDTYGYITYDIKDTLTFAGIQNVSVKGKTLECAVYEVEQSWTGVLDSGYRYREARAKSRYYYAKGIGYCRYEVTESESGASVIDLERIISVAEFEKLKSGK